MKFSELKNIYSELADNFDNDEIREIIENIANEETDFNCNDYRFINMDEIDTILADELKSDPYILGCFTAWFIANNTDLSIDIVEALQSADKYDAIGNHIIDNDFVNDIAQDYIRHDGYGHHFNPYDGNEYELLNYYYFRIN